MPKRTQSICWQAVLVLSLILFDQLTKYLANSNLVYGEPIMVTPFLNWTLLYNTGAAFSFLNTGTSGFNIGFIVFATLACFFILNWLRTLNVKQHWQRLALLFILSGAIGNVIDRVVHGHVIDFIELHIKQYSWPVFNIADSAISVGAVLFLISLARKES